MKLWYRWGTWLISLVKCYTCSATVCKARNWLITAYKSVTRCKAWHHLYLRKYNDDWDAELFQIRIRLVRDTREIAKTAAVCDAKKLGAQFFERRQDLRLLSKELHHGKDYLQILYLLQCIPLKSEEHLFFILKVLQSSVSYFTVLASFQ